MKNSGEFEIRKYQVSYELETERPKGKLELTGLQFMVIFEKLIGREST
jgi:hypothetical protein